MSLEGSLRVLLEVAKTALPCAAKRWQRAGMQNRHVPIEPALMPPLTAMHAEAEVDRICIEIGRFGGAGGRQRRARSAAPGMPPIRALHTELNGSVYESPPRCLFCRAFGTPPDAAFWSSSDVQTLRSRILPRNST